VIAPYFCKAEKALQKMVITDVLREDMKSITLILNSAIMALFGLGSCLAHFRVTDIGKRPQAYPNHPGWFPNATEIAINLRWMWSAVPILWLTMSLALMLLLRKKQHLAQDVVALHSSVTILVGFAMLMFFLATGIIPCLEWPPFAIK